MSDIKNIDNKNNPSKIRLPMRDASHILICGGTIDNIDIDTGAKNTTSGIERYLTGFVNLYQLID